MLRNYLLVALRSFRRRLGFASINVIGLGVGIACCAVIALYVWGELSYDEFHEDSELIYRVESDWRPAGGNISLATVNYPFVNVLKTDYPEYPIATLYRSGGMASVRRGEMVFREEGIFYANQDFFDVFSFRLERGHEATAFTDPYTVVLSREMARKYFGDEDPVGESLFFGDWELVVTGVLAPADGPTHIPLKILISWITLETINFWQLEAWSANNQFTYIRFPSQAEAVALEEQFPDLIERYAADTWPGSTLSLRPLTDIHLHSNHTGELTAGGNPAYVTLFGIVALFILLLAGVNFVNLSTARSLERAKEVGVRKSMGAVQGQLARQFLAEAVVLAMVGLLVAVVLIAIAVPSLTALVGRPLLPDAQTLLVAALVALVGTLVVGIGGGLYPAFALSRFRPTEVLRGTFATGRGGVRLRQGLVVFQFAVAVVLLVGTFVVYNQLEHLRTADLGFDEAQVLAFHGPAAPTTQRLAFFEALRADASIENVASLGERFPAELRGGTGRTLPDLPVEEDEPYPGVSLRSVYVSADFFETLGVPIVAGQSFRAGSAADSAAIILNESAARALAALAPDRYLAPENLVGETIRAGPGTEQLVLAVVPDFHMASLNERIENMAFFMAHTGTTYAVRIAPGAVTPALSTLRERWAEFFPEAALEYYFVDEAFAAAYRAEEQLSVLALIFAALAILVACLGLFGLAAYAAEARRKEIGVRKVLGASVAGVVALLSKDFVRLVAIAVVVGAPVAYFAMSRWLEGFPLRVELGPGPFLLAGVLAVLIALITVSGQALRAATSDPVKSIRME
jgi:putative ABC transport system permease protein